MWRAQPARRRAPRHFPDARRAPKSTTAHATLDYGHWRSYLLAGYLPAVCVRNLPIHPLLSPIPSECTLGALLARCGMFWRADVSLPSHTHTHAHAPAAVLPAALTAPAPGACGHTPCLRRARPPYAPAHTWRGHLQSAAYLSQTADWGTAVAGVTMVMVIPAGVAGVDGFFLKWWTLLTTCLRR